MAKRAYRDTLLETITSRATASFGEYPKEAPKEVRDKWFDGWFDHWIDVAEKYRQEMLDEGLTDTADSIKAHIEFNKSLKTRWSPGAAEQSVSRLDRDPPEKTIYVEPELDDNYPVYGDYLYMVDGRRERSDVFGSVRDLKRDIIQQGRTAERVCRYKFGK